MSLLLLPDSIYAEGGMQVNQTALSRFCHANDNFRKDGVGLWIEEDLTIPEPEYTSYQGAAVEK
jgi:hypothetical protein